MAEPIIKWFRVWIHVGATNYALHGGPYLLRMGNFRGFQPIEKHWYSLLHGIQQKELFDDFNPQ